MLNEDTLMIVLTSIHKKQKQKQKRPYITSLISADHPEIQPALSAIVLVFCHAGTDASHRENVSLLKPCTPLTPARLHNNHEQHPFDTLQGHR